MTDSQRISLKGWTAWQSRRRRQLRATRGFSLSRAAQSALHETRCRVQIERVIGRPQAKKLLLATLEGGGEYSDSQFLLVEPIEYSVWKQLEHIPGLVRVVE